MEKNLLELTLELMKYYGLSISDIQWIGSIDGGYTISWDEFSKYIEKVNYEDSNCTFRMHRNTVIVFDKCYLKWLSEDMECWEYIRMPVVKDNPKKYVPIF